MTVYYQTLSLQYLSTNPTPTTLNISSSDTIELGIDTSSYADGNGWLRYGTPVGCTTSATSGADGQAVVITPNVGATTYSVTFRTLISETSTYYYGRISGTISAPPTSDTTPNAFTFTDQAGVALSSTITSNTITVSGIDSLTPISVTGGTYSINGGAYTSSSGTVTNGQTVTVQHTSSGANSTATNTTLNIGGVSDVFTSTTVAAAPDTTPDAFTFIDQTNVALNTVITSAAITVSGITAAAAISIIGGTYSINGGPYTSATGSITNGASVTVRHTSSASNSTATGTQLTVGGVSDIFTSITVAVAADTTPDAFTFTDQTNVALNTTTTSNTITVSGINAATSISITGGTYSISGGAYTSSSGTVTNGQTVSVRHTSSASNSTSTNTTLTIGGVSDVFTSTTVAVAVDTTPNAFTFTDQTNVALNTVITSNTITVSGINAASAISITSGTYSISGGAYTSTAGTVTNGQTVTVRHTSSASNSTSTNTTLTIGGVSDVFTSTTVAAAADTVPNAFIFADQNDVAVSSIIVSSEIEILGINTGAPISITGGEYSIGLDPTTYTPYTSASGTIYNTQTVKVRHTSSSANNTSTSTTLTVGGVSDVFTSTTIGAISAGIYGLQIFDSLGNITLDTSDITIKDFGIFSVASVTANGTITGVPLTSNSIALVNNNNGDGNTAIAAPAVTLAPASNSIVVSGGAVGFDVSIRVMEF